jgi:glycine/D-amino acid oxidase-like deaminating enzyme
MTSHAMSLECDDLVVGGGFFGCSLAVHLRDACGSNVVLLEAGADLLQRASYTNQARVHNGYHYPRSLLTALRSRVNYPRFLAKFADCVDESFEKYYAISRGFSKVTANQFRILCETIGAPIASAPAHVRKMFDSHLIEDVFTVRECAFDSVKLKQRMVAELDRVGVEVRLQNEAKRVQQLPNGELLVDCTGPSGDFQVMCKRVFNCTYSRINRLLEASDLPLIPLKHELTEISLVEMPEELRNLGVTVMCGPFFSVMPFPSRGLHSFSHVRYTPHCQWQDVQGQPYMDPYSVASERRRSSNFVRMVADAKRYMPALAQCKQVDYLLEVKTVLPRSEVDDSRPILFRQDHGLPGLNCIMGAKIDNIFDMIEFVSAAEALSSQGIA